MRRLSAGVNPTPSPPIWRCYTRPEWVVYAKRPFGGHEAVLVALSRYTHRVAISNSPLIALNDAGVSFKWKDYRAKGREKAKEMTLPPPTPTPTGRGFVPWWFSNAPQCANPAHAQGVRNLHMTGHEPERYADTNSIARETVRAGAPVIDRAGGAWHFSDFRGVPPTTMSAQTQSQT